MIIADLKPKMPSRLYRVICHNGLEIAPEHPMAAVKNLGHACKCDPASLCGGRRPFLGL